MRIAVTHLSSATFHEPTVSNVRWIVPGIAGLLLLLAPTVRASEISFLNSFKNLSNEQTGNGNTLTLNGYFYSADLNTIDPNPYTSATLTYPGPGSPMNLPQINPTDYGIQTGFFPTKSAMDTAFPFGTYTFTSNTGDSASYDYTADDYPGSLPFLTGTDFTSLQGMNSTQPFTFHFSPYVTGSKATDSFIFFTVFDSTKNTTAFTDNFLTPGTTSVVMPANTLTPGDLYSYELDYSNRDILTGGGTAQFPPQLGFDVRTDGVFSAAPAAATPEPSTAVLFGIGFFVATVLRRRCGATLQRAATLTHQ
jgi:hypothetical protein